MATQNKEIFVAKLPGINLESLEEKLKNLEDIASGNAKDKIIKALAEITPRFREDDR